MAELEVEPEPVIEPDTSLSVVEALPAPAPLPGNMVELAVASEAESVTDVAAQLIQASLPETVVELEPEPEAEQKPHPDVEAQSIPVSLSECVPKLRI